MLYLLLLLAEIQPHHPMSSFLFVAIMHTDTTASCSTSGRTPVDLFCQITMLLLFIFTSLISICLLLFFVFFFPSSCPFTNKLCHNGWVWDSDKCECVADVQHSNRREGKIKLTMDTSPHYLQDVCVAFRLCSTSCCESCSFDSMSLDRPCLQSRNSPENQHWYVYPHLIFFPWTF